MPRDRPGASADRARALGILLEFTDASGRVRPIAQRTLARLLAALTSPVPTERRAGARRSSASRGDASARPALPGNWFLSVENARRARSIPWRLAAGVKPSLRLEGRRTSRRLLEEAPGRFRLPPGVPAGVHALYLEGANAPSVHSLIVYPKRLPRPRPARAWGLFAPAYAIRTRETWGAGDLRSLELLGRWAARHGASVLATLPLLPAFLDHPYDPSPYRPVTRQFWNEFYIDPRQTPEFRRSKTLARWTRGRQFLSEVERLERREHVDFRGVMRLKRRLLEQMLREFHRAPTPRRRAFERFAQRTVTLREYARFRSSLESQPARAVAYHTFVQWLVTEQLHQVARRLERRGLRLAFDLPIGTHPQGFDVRRGGDQYASKFHVGSPPDPGVPDGQDWGLAPLEPRHLADAGYRPFSEALRHQLSVARILRIDHALGLHRLFWIPRGEPPRRGAYVRYPARDLYRILLAEAAHAGATIIGEDLGTVPPDVRPALRRRGILGVYVAELEWDGPGRPRRIPSLSVVSVNTHDHLPFAGYWTRRTRIVRSTARASGFPPTTWSADRALDTTLQRLAASRARLFLVNPEDLWGETRPQNAPGRGGRNFTRRFRTTLEELGNDPRAAERLCTIARLRKSGTPK